MRWWPRKTQPAERPEQDEVDAPPTGPVDEHAELTRLAHAHLPTDTARRWLSLLRPAIRLVPAAPGQPVLARLGGRPVVPEDFTWPAWPGHGPLAFIGEVDLEAVVRSGLDCGLDLPADGRLLGFYFDGSFDDFVGLVGTWDKDSLVGAQLVHVCEARDECVERAAPDRVLEFSPQELTGLQAMTYPNWEHPALRQEFGAPGEDVREWMAHPVNDDDFAEALDALDDGPRHQIGGWATPVQGPVELEVAQAALDEPFQYGDARHSEEARQWSLLWQVDSDDASDMMWGDVGCLYWLTRAVPERSAGGSAEAAAGGSAGLGAVSFTWQCS